jgi:hypothetical protein
LEKISIKENNIFQKEINNLYLIQSFSADNECIWVAKLRKDGKYLALGGKSCALKIWKIKSINDNLDEYDKNGINGYFKFINELPFRIYKEHLSDITDICWGINVNFFILFFLFYFILLIFFTLITKESRYFIIV